MDLWIRSQSKKTLVKINKIEIMQQFTNNFSTNGEKLSIENAIVGNDNCLLASYKTKERALEVLDEIQKLVDDMLNYDHMEYKVYEMPKE